MLVTESDDKDKVDITGAVAKLVVVELEDSFAETVEVKHALVTDIVDVEQVVVTGEVKNGVAATPGEEEAKCVATNEGGGTEEVSVEAGAAVFDMAAWCRAAHCLFLSLSEGPRWRGR